MAPEKKAAENEKDKGIAEPVEERYAEGVRKTARWIAAGLGAIPGLALAGAIVRAPAEDEKFDTTLLAFGVGLAAAGAVLGLWAFARVIAPTLLRDKDLESFEMGKIGGHKIPTFPELSDEIKRLLAAIPTEEEQWKTERAKANQAQTDAADADLAAKKAEAAAAASPNDANLKRLAVEARAVADQKKNEADVAKGDAEVAQGAYQDSLGQLQARRGLRREVYRLREDEIASERYGEALLLVVPAVAAVAAGFVFLGIAPEPRASEASSPTLVSLTLNADGKAALECQADVVEGLKVGGTEDAPEVITFPLPDCPSKLVVFETAEPTPLGTIEEVKAVEVPTEGSTDTTTDRR